MQILNDSEFTAFFDVDGTLVDTLSPQEYAKYKSHKFKIENPYQPGTYLLRKKRMGNINLLKDLKGRGYKIVIWSHAGGLYAAAVAKSLGLEDYIEYAMTKPNKHVDDRQDLEGIVGMRAFIDE